MTPQANDRSGERRGSAYRNEMVGMDRSPRRRQRAGGRAVRLLRRSRPWFGNAPAAVAVLSKRTSSRRRRVAPEAWDRCGEPSLPIGTRGAPCGLGKHGSGVPWLHCGQACGPHVPTGEGLFAEGAGIDAGPGEVFGEAEGIDDFFGFVGLDEGLALGVHQAGGDEDDEIFFDFLVHIGAEEASGERDVAEDRDFVVDFLHILADESAEGDSLAVPDADTRGDFANGEDGLVHHIFSNGEGAYP